MARFLEILMSNSENSFASKTTLDGLKITVRSVMDLVEYLTQTLGFSYVLTNKLNQDCLEVCLP